MQHYQLPKFPKDPNDYYLKDWEPNKPSILISKLGELDFVLIEEEEEVKAVLVRTLQTDKSQSKEVLTELNSLPFPNRFIDWVEIDYRNATREDSREMDNINFLSSHFLRDMKPLKAWYLVEQAIKCGFKVRGEYFLDDWLFHYLGTAIQEYISFNKKQSAEV